MNIYILCCMSCRFLTLSRNSTGRINIPQKRPHSILRRNQNTIHCIIRLENKSFSPNVAHTIRVFCTNLGLIVSFYTYITLASAILHNMCYTVRTVRYKNSILDFWIGIVGEVIFMLTGNYQSLANLRDCVKCWRRMHKPSQNGRKITIK